ncbi:MAG: HAMP domain-containing histidine kinase [Planctomycetes bacterium]|nr:HAMP domain-containing histidine kinase [Planctomycetota bacterium]
MSDSKKTPDRSKLWQQVFLGLLFVCVAQVSYWVVEQIGQAQKGRDIQLNALSAHETLLEDKGNDLKSLRASKEAQISFAKNVIGDQASTSLDPAATIHDEFESRKTRILWEGSFFLFVLLGTMGVISRTLSESRRLVESQQNFIASVTHELRTPLASLKLSADTLGMRAPDKEQSERLSTRMNEDVQRLNEMVSQILQSARLEAGAPNNPPSPTALTPLLTDEVSRIHTLLSPRGVNFYYDDASPEVQVQARRPELKTVISNLLSNAGKSCRAAGGGTVKVSVSIQRGMARITVEDDGIGFDPQQAQKIFERFYRPGDEMRRETSGYGLGLYLVDEITRNHGGSVQAHSDGQGAGAPLTLLWPLCKGDSAS